MAELKTKLDIKDKKILFELEKDARQSNQVIGRKVGLKPDLVRYRINRLLENGVIDKFLAYVNFAKLGYTDFGVFINTKGLTDKKEKEFIKYIRNHNNVSYFSKVGGKYDFIIGILAKDVLHFNNILTEIMNKYGNYILNKDISIRIELFHFSKDYLINKKEIASDMPYFGGKINKIKLDVIDKKILKALSINARMNTVDIADKIKSPHSTISLRIKRLKALGIISGFYALINPSKLGYDSYNVPISFKNISKEIEIEFYNFCKMNKNISWLIKTVGAWDYEVGIEAPSKEVFQKSLSMIRESFSQHITNTDIVIIFDTIKYNLYPFKSE